MDVEQKLPGDCAGGHPSDLAAQWRNIDYLSSMPPAQAQNGCVAPRGPGGCIVVACTDIAEGHPGFPGAAIVSLCNDDVGSLSQINYFPFFFLFFLGLFSF